MAAATDGTEGVLVPFAASTYGRLSHTAIQLLRTLARVHAIGREEAEIASSGLARSHLAPRLTEALFRRSLAIIAISRARGLARRINKFRQTLGTLTTSQQVHLITHP